jgi:hypothetical protein
MSAKPTVGPWTTTATVLKNGRGESIASGGNNRAVTGAELYASLSLAAEAGTVLHETGCTPRQLAEQRDELVAALEHFIRWHDQISKADLAMAAKVLVKVRGGAK